MPDLVRWNDDRLDDLAREVHTMTPMREEMVRIDERTAVAATNSATCLAKLEELEQHLQDRETVQLRERKTDRRWMIGTLLTTAGLVIAALAIFVG